MRILWFSVTPSMFNPYSNAHHGGGWIASLEQIVRQNMEIELGIAFYFRDENKRYEKDGVTYYTLPNDNRNMLAKWLKPEKEEDRINRYLKVIEDFKPDVIQIFGSENDFGLICGETDAPVVIHIQGSLPPYHNALFPVGMNKYDFLTTKGLTWRRRLIGLRSEPAFRRNADREEKILRTCSYFMGRTLWDKNIVSLYNPEATYFHCEEALRDSFINSSKKWAGGAGNKFKIVSVISTPWYKGADLILKAAGLLKDNTQIDYEWDVYGVSDIRFFENKYGIKAKEVNVFLKGTVDKDLLVDALCAASCYVHPSYIDNSPNSLCEAQYLGVPVITTNVGGISSLVDDGNTGMLFPANDPYTLAATLKKINDNPTMASELGTKGRERAMVRHNPEKLVETLFNIYSAIINA